ncbi:hypothetical protein BJ165DRAFT_205637 [Panaeolus papilionaceus]|nr:hypothetical protein BJ165DRAFT_205637 [Panaeolus papilionaceus]
MSEVVNVLVAFAVIVFIFRWVTSGNESSGERSPSDILGFRPKNITQEMVTTISNMFPDVPVDNIRYDLLRTGSVELTTNKILERGFLDAPPTPYFNLYPRQQTTTAPRPPVAVTGNANLEDRIQRGETVEEDKVGGKAVWEDSSDKREASLKERKAQMILAARQRFLAQQKEAEAKKAS